MICSSISAILFLLSAVEAISWPRSPSALAEIALQGNDPRKLHEVLLPEGHDALQLLADPFDFVDLGGLLRDQPGDLLPKLSDALLELRLLALARLSPDDEQPLLRRP